MFNPLWESTITIVPFTWLHIGQGLGRIFCFLGIIDEYTPFVLLDVINILSSVEDTKILESIRIIYFCEKCGIHINPKTFFCETCNYQFYVETSSWVPHVLDFVIHLKLLAIIYYGMMKEWDSVENVPRLWKQLKSFVDVVRIKLLENLDSVSDVLNDT